MPEVNCTWTASFSWIVKEAALWFESYGSKNLTGGTTWSSQSTSTDWLTRTYHWSSPRSKLAYKKPASTRKLWKFPVTSCQGSKYRDWTASRWWARWRSQSSSCKHHVITWRGLIPADHEYLDSVAWPCHDCEVAPVWHHDVTNARTCQFFAVCLTVFPFEFRPRTFTIGFYGKNSIISELMILECSFPLTFFLSLHLVCLLRLLCTVFEFHKVGLRRRRWWMGRRKRRYSKLQQIIELLKHNNIGSYRRCQAFSLVCQRLQVSSSQITRISFDSVIFGELQGRRLDLCSRCRLSPSIHNPDD